MNKHRSTKQIVGLLRQADGDLGNGMPLPIGPLHSRQTEESFRSRRVFVHLRRMICPVVVAASMLAGHWVDAGTIVLSQTTSGLTWAPGETGFNDYVNIDTSGGPSGPADDTLVLEVLAPAGQAFAVDGSGYASQSGISFSFRPILGVSGSNDGWSFSPPTFSLLGASGVSVGTATTQSWEPQGTTQFYLNTLFQLSGNGTFTGFRMTTNLTGPFAGQTISFQGGDASATNSTSIFPLDPFSVGPVLSLVVVPEPSAGLLALGALAWCALPWMRLGASRFDGPGRAITETDASGWRTHT